MSPVHSPWLLRNVARRRNDPAQCRFRQQLFRFTVCREVIALPCGGLHMETAGSECEISKVTMKRRTGGCRQRWQQERCLRLRAGSIWLMHAYAADGGRCRWLIPHVFKRKRA